jgi:hypothetical protein
MTAILASRAHQRGSLNSFFVRGASGSWSSSDSRYLRHPLRNCGQSGTLGTGSVDSGSSFHRVSIEICQIVIHIRCPGLRSLILPNFAAAAGCAWPARLRAGLSYVIAGYLPAD